MHNRPGRGRRWHSTNGWSGASESDEFGRWPKRAGGTLQDEGRCPLAMLSLAFGQG